jgi:hypothetical protein
MSEQREEKEKAKVTGNQVSFVLESGADFFLGELEDVLTETEHMWMLKDVHGNIIRREVVEPVVDASTLADCAREFFVPLLIEESTIIVVTFE